MKIAIVIATLGRGGAEKVAAFLGNALAERGHSLTLITFDDASRDVFKLSSNVDRVGLEVMSVSNNRFQSAVQNLRRILLLRRTLHQISPSVAIAFMDATSVLTVMATFGSEIRSIVCERVDPRLQPLAWAWRFLRRMTYRFAAAIVVQSDTLRPWAEGLVASDSVWVIPNPVVVPENVALAEVKKHGRQTIVSLGRLTYQKGFDLLIEAFARIAPRHPGWELAIHGDGEQRALLEGQVAALQMGDRIRLLGAIVDPWTVLAAADLFVLASRWEGFPNALLEAMAAGLPVIATDCSSGPREIVRPGDDGILVSPYDVEELARAMDGLMSNPEERARLAARAPDVRARFAADKILASWEELLSFVARNSECVGSQG